MSWMKYNILLPKVVWNSSWGLVTKCQCCRHKHVWRYPDFLSKIWCFIPKNTAWNRPDVSSKIQFVTTNTAEDVLTSCVVSHLKSWNPVLNRGHWLALGHTCNINVMSYVCLNTVRSSTTEQCVCVHGDVFLLDQTVIHTTLIKIKHVSISSLVSW